MFSSNDTLIVAVMLVDPDLPEHLDNVRRKTYSCIRKRTHTSNRFRSMLGPTFRVSFKDLPEESWNEPSKTTRIFSSSTE